MPSWLVFWHTAAQIKPCHDSGLFCTHIWPGTYIKLWLSHPQQVLMWFYVHPCVNFVLYSASPSPSLRGYMCIRANVGTTTAVHPCTCHKQHKFTHGSIWHVAVHTSLQERTVSLGDVGIWVTPVIPHAPACPVAQCDTSWAHPGLQWLPTGPEFSLNHQLKFPGTAVVAGPLRKHRARSCLFPPRNSHTCHFTNETHLSPITRQLACVIFKHCLSVIFLTIC